ncbi:MAG: SDR family NAD(P)-dependent oxidoreductase [Acidimicrobiia bacterium]
MHKEIDTMLQNKNAVIYGGSGAIGGAVARAFAREGAKVFLAARNETPLKRVAGEINEAGGTVETAQVDALDIHSVEAFVNSVVKKTGRLDISFCATSTHVPGGDQRMTIPNGELN